MGNIWFVLAIGCNISHQTLLTINFPSWHFVFLNATEIRRIYKMKLSQITPVFFFLLRRTLEIEPL